MIESIAEKVIEKTTFIMDKANTMIQSLIMFDKIYALVSYIVMQLVYQKLFRNLLYKNYMKKVMNQKVYKDSYLDSQNNWRRVGPYFEVDMYSMKPANSQ